MSLDRRLGVGLDDFRLPPKQALKEAARLGFGAVELGAWTGQITPEALSESGRRHVRRLCASLGLVPAALTADPAPGGLADAQRVEGHVERTCKVLDLARDLGVTVVVAAVGPIIDPATGQPFDLVSDALRAVAERADRTGTVYAIQSGPTPPEQLQSVVEGLGCGSIRTCVDPANLARMGFDPVLAVDQQAGSLGAARLGDATLGRAEHVGVETPLGQGQVDLAGYWTHLAAADYRKPLILRRRQSASPGADLLADLQAWRRLGLSVEAKVR